MLQEHQMQEFKIGSCSTRIKFYHIVLIIGTELINDHIVPKPDVEFFLNSHIVYDLKSIIPFQTFENIILYQKGYSNVRIRHEKSSKHSAATFLVNLKFPQIESFI